MPKDARILRKILKDAIGGNLAKGTALLKAFYPLSMVNFLVGMGIYGYKDGDYWPAVEDSVGKLGPRIRGEWGKFFLSFLHKNRLPFFDINQSQVLPSILGHGGIPESCLKNFFAETVFPLLAREVTHKKEAAYELTLLRENNTRWENLQQSIRKLEEKEAALKVKISGVKEKVFKLARYRELYPPAQEIVEVRDLPLDFAGFKKALDEKLEKLKEEKDQLVLKKEELREHVKGFSKNDQRLIDHAEDLVVSIKEYQKLKKTLRGFYKLQKEEENLLHDLEGEASPLFQGGWDPEYGAALRKVDFFEHDHRIAQLQNFLPRDLLREGGSILECCQVKLNSQGDVPFASILSEKKSREVLELLEGDRACIKMDLQENGIKNIKLIRKDEGQLVFAYEKGVQCMTCGEKIASQDIWNKNHYPKCKSLVPNIEHSEVKATLIWPTANIERSIPQKLRFGKELLNEIFTLYTEHTANVQKLMEGLIQDGQNLEKVTQALFSKEKHIFKELSQLAQKE